MNRERVKEYKEKLEAGIEEYMEMPLSQRSAEAVESMVECLEHINKLLEYSDSCDELTEDEINEWVDGMENADGTTGAHWSVEETNSVGRPSNVDELYWYATMNMIYSDYCKVFKQYGVGTAQFYSDVAKAFLDDQDAPADKIDRYFHFIVEA